MIYLANIRASSSYDNIIVLACFERRTVSWIARYKSLRQQQLSNFINNELYNVEEESL